MWVKKILFVLIILIFVFFSLIFIYMFSENTATSNEEIINNSNIMEYIPIDKNIYVELKQEDINKDIKNITVEDIVLEYIEKYNLNTNNFSFAYYNLETNNSYYYNEDKWFTAASTSKVPLAMLYIDKINSKEISKDDKIPFTSQAYEIGDGNTALDYNIGDKVPITYLLKELIVNSDNTASNILSFNLGGRQNYRDYYANYTNIELPQNFVADNITSAIFSQDLLKTLDENEEDYIDLLEYMKQSSYGSYLKKYINYDVAHKYGSYEGYVHDFGIVYAKQKYMIGIFTKNVTEAQELIANLNLDICNLQEREDYGS